MAFHKIQSNCAKCHSLYKQVSSPQFNVCEEICFLMQRQIGHQLILLGLHESKSSCGNSYRIFVSKYFMKLGRKLSLLDNIFNHKKMSLFAVNNSK